MITRALGLLALVTSIGLAGGAQATPYAGDYRYFSATPIAVHGADGARWVLTVTATKSGGVESRAEQRLYVDLDRCDSSGCVAKGRWSRPLVDSEIAIDRAFDYQPVSTGTPDPVSARLSTRLGGRLLTVSLSEANSNGGIDVGGLGGTPHVVNHRSAVGTLRLAGVACTVPVRRAEIGEMALVDVTGDDARDPRTAPPATLPAGFLTGTRTARC